MATELQELREQLKTGGYFRRYLEETGRTILAGGQLRCPDSTAHPNGDRNPSAHLYEDGSGDRVKCFGCGKSWDIFSLVQEDEGTDFPGALETLADRFGLPYPRRAKARRGKARQLRETPPEKPTIEAGDETSVAPEGRPASAQEFLDTCAARIEETDYFSKRGISLETAKRLGCGFDPSHYFPSLHDRRPAVIFPAARGWASRAVTEKTHSFLKGMKGGSAFNLEALDAADETSAVFIVEGQFDALAIEEAGGRALATGGVQHITELVERVRRNPPRCALIVSFDNEENPQKRATVEKAASRLEEELRAAGAFVYRTGEPAFPEHDANDALLANRQDFETTVKSWIWQASEAYALQVLDGDDTPDVKTGFWKSRSRTFADIPEPLPEEKNPRALFKRGFLRKGHAACLVSCAGVGKSVVSLQLALSWSIGRPCLGIEPIRPLRIGIFTFEDDDEDNADFRRDFREGFRRDGWSEEEINRALASVDIINLEGRTDERFADALEDIQIETPHDLYFVNPLGDIVDEYDLSDNTSAKHFFKKVLDPVIKGEKDSRTQCGLILVSHTGKAPKSSKDREGFMRGTFAQYDAQGAAALMNWARAILLISPTSTSGDFVLLGAKRQARLGWKDADGRATGERYISHSPDIKFWIPTPEERIRKMIADGKPSGAVDPAQDASLVAQTLRSLTSGIPATQARSRAQAQLGQARGNAAFAAIAKNPAAYNVAYEKIGRTEYYGGCALGLTCPETEIPEGLEDIDF